MVQDHINICFPISLVPSPSNHPRALWLAELTSQGHLSLLNSTTGRTGVNTHIADKQVLLHASHCSPPLKLMERVPAVFVLHQDLFPLSALADMLTSFKNVQLYSLLHQQCSVNLSWHLVVHSPIDSYSVSSETRPNWPTARVPAHHHTCSPLPCPAAKISDIVSSRGRMIECVYITWPCAFHWQPSLATEQLLLCRPWLP